MSRFDEDLVVSTPGTPPRVAHQLLVQLGVRGKPRDVQRAAVAEWLRHNPMPSDFVRDGLERMGLIDPHSRAA
jgi:hypothetical protein